MLAGGPVGGIAWTRLDVQPMTPSAVANVNITGEGRAINGEDCSAAPVSS
jgi:hypothetical protein